MNPEGYDVAVVGGGPAGAAAALTLAKAKRRVLLVDQTPPPSADGHGFKVGEGLPPAARPLLRDLGVLEDFSAQGHLVSHGNQSAWGGRALATHDFLRDPNGSGWHLDRGRFDAMLRRRAADAGVDLCSATRVASLRREGGGDSSTGEHGWRLQLAVQGGSGRTVWSRRLIDATGRAARFARQLGAHSRSLDRLVAFAAVFQPTTSVNDRDSMTLVESVADGWWYTALLPAGRRVAAFLTDHDLLVARQARRADGYGALLAETAHVRKRLRGYRRVEGPWGAPAASSRLQPLAGRGWVALGDAALAFDPLSSQGMMTALYGGLRGGRAVAAELDGAPGAIAGFGAELERVWKAYLAHRTVFYGQEKRWSEREFWRRRSTGTFHRKPAGRRMNKPALTRSG